MIANETMDSVFAKLTASGEGDADPRWSTLTVLALPPDRVMSDNAILRQRPLPASSWLQRAIFSESEMTHFSECVLPMRQFINNHPARRRPTSLHSLTCHV